MKQAFCILIILLSTKSTIFAQKPKVIILGVEHSSQLINYNHQPSALRTFINKVNPAAICIERSPEEFSRNDFYEFTYEQQYVIIPFANQKKIPLHPIDWYPDSDDLKLAFGMSDLEVPAFTRQEKGFLGFTTFTENIDFEKDLYFADNPEYVKSIEKWYANLPEKVNFDFPRRLFLYRTFLQASRIQKVLQNYKSNDTILVVIGAFHKNDIEKNLRDNGYEIVQPNSYGTIEKKDIDANFEKMDSYAILSFNLLGMQSYNDKINKELVNQAFDQLKEENNTEINFLKIKYDLFLKKIDSKEAIKQYKNLLTNSDSDRDFTWNGVKNKSRIDSYFDPFGNLNVLQRIHLELLREYSKTSNLKGCQSETEVLSKGLNTLKNNMLLEYIRQYIKK